MLRQSYLLWKSVYNVLAFWNRTKCGLRWTPMMMDYLCLSFDIWPKNTRSNILWCAVASVDWDKPPRTDGKSLADLLRPALSIIPPLSFYPRNKANTMSHSEIKLVKRNLNKSVRQSFWDAASVVWGIADRPQEATDNAQRNKMRLSTVVYNLLLRIDVLLRAA